MTSKKNPTPKAATHRGATPNTTLVVRVPESVKAAIETNGEAHDVGTAGYVRKALANQLLKDGCSLSDATRLACHLD